MLLKLFKLLIGILLLPACVAVSQALWFVLQTVMMRAEGGRASWNLYFCAGGALFWLFAFFCMPRPARAYVLGHELTHALWAIGMGGRAKKIRINNHGGSVQLSKINFLISLAPYFFPFYTFCLLLIYGAVAWRWDQTAYQPAWMAGVGLTWAFHITFTVELLLQHQPDIQENGRLFSCVVIYFLNLLALSVGLVLLGQMPWGDYGDRFLAYLIEDYQWVWDTGWGWVAKRKQ